MLPPTRSADCIGFVPLHKLQLEESGQRTTPVSKNASALVSDQ